MAGLDAVQAVSHHSVRCRYAFKDLDPAILPQAGDDRPLLHRHAPAFLDSDKDRGPVTLDGHGGFRQGHRRADALIDAHPQHHARLEQPLRAGELGPGGEGPGPLIDAGVKAQDTAIEPGIRPGVHRGCQGLPLPYRGQETIRNLEVHPDGGEIIQGHDRRTRTDHGTRGDVRETDDPGKGRADHPVAKAGFGGTYIGAGALPGGLVLVYRGS